MLRRLLDVNSVYARDSDLKRTAGQTLDAAIAITNADMRNIQLCHTGRNHLKSPREVCAGLLGILEHRQRGQGPCGTALARGEQSVLATRCNNSF